MTLSPALMHFLSPDKRTVIFAVKGLSAVSMALAVSMTLDLDKPFWAIVASMMLQARPETGLVIEKACFLFLGSIIGAVLAMSILDNFSSYPVIAIACLAMCIGATTMASSSVRHVNFTFAFSLVSVTATMIVLFSMADAATVSSHSIFSIARARISEVMVGASCAALSSLVLFPFKVEKVLENHTHAVINSVKLYMSSLLSPDSSHEEIKQTVNNVIISAGHVSNDSYAGRYESARNVKASVFIANQSVSLLACGQDIRHLMEEHPEVMDKRMQAIFTEIACTLEEVWSVEGSKRIEKIALLAENLTSYKDNGRDSLLIQSWIFHSLLKMIDVLNDILKAHHAMQTEALCSFSAPRFRSHRDLLFASVSAARSVTVFLAGVTLWVVTSGSTALVMMIVLPVLFAQMFSAHPQATLIVRKILIGTLISIPVSTLFGLGLMARGTGSFEVLILIIAGPLFVALMGMTNASIMPISLGFSVGFAVLTQPSNFMAFAIDQSLTIGLGMAAGMAMLYLGFEIIEPPSRAVLRRRAIESIANDLRKAGKGKHQEMWFNSKMAERLLHISGTTCKSTRRQMVSKELAGLDIGHLSLQIHRQLESLGGNKNKETTHWRSVLADAYREAIRGQHDPRLDQASSSLLEAVSSEQRESVRITQVQSMLERVRFSLARLAQDNASNSKI